MDRKWKSGAAGAPPALDNASDGYATAGNPGTGTPATKPGPHWYHMVTEEILAVLTAAGIAFDKTSVVQLRDAIKKLVVTGNTADAAPAAADEIVFYDVSEGANNKATIAELLATLIASQAEQEAAAVTTKVVTPARQQFHPSAVKSWVKTNLSGGIDGSYNVDSITDVGTGIVTINWATDYSAVGNCMLSDCQSDSAAFSAIANTAIAAGVTQVRSWNTAGSAVDTQQMYCAGMGDQ